MRDEHRLTPQQPTPSPLFIGRLIPGLGGERARVAHLFPPQETDTGRLRALCGARLRIADLEWLPEIGGMPCDHCLAHVRRPGEAEPVKTLPCAPSDSRILPGPSTGHTNPLPGVAEAPDPMPGETGQRDPVSSLPGPR